MFRVTRLGLAKTCGQGRVPVSSLSNNKNAGFGLKVFEKQNFTQLNGPNFPCRQFSSYRLEKTSLPTGDEKGKKKLLNFLPLAILIVLWTLIIFDDPDEGQAKGKANNGRHR